VKEAPEIVEILRNEERLGLLASKSYTTSKKQPSSEIPSDKISDKTTTAATKPDETTTTIDNINKQKITEEQLKQNQKEIEIQIIQLKKLDKIKSNILKITSHELRTPIAAIKGYIQIILKEKLGKINEEQKKSLEIVLRNANRLDHLIQDILDISRLESGIMRFVPEKTNIKNMVEEIVETILPTANIKKISINTKVEKYLSDLMVDQERVKQVIINLLNNAIKFSPDNSKINVNVRKDKDLISFEVEDYGRGIPKDQQGNIFNAYFQIKSDEDKKSNGVGLGLAISRGIIIAHGGCIWVESTLGEGSKFTFTLPVKPVQDIESRFKKIDIFDVEE
jgi:signal transduction histidine kinase